MILKSICTIAYLATAVVARYISSDIIQRHYEGLSIAIGINDSVSVPMTDLFTVNNDMVDIEYEINSPIVQIMTIDSRHTSISLSHFNIVDVDAVYRAGAEGISIIVNDSKAIIYCSSVDDILADKCVTVKLDAIANRYSCSRPLYEKVQRRLMLACANVEYAEGVTAKAVIYVASLDGKTGSPKLDEIKTELEVEGRLHLNFLRRGYTTNAIIYSANPSSPNIMNVQFCQGLSGIDIAKAECSNNWITDLNRQKDGERPLESIRYLMVHLSNSYYLVAVGVSLKSSRLILHKCALPNDLPKDLSKIDCSTIEMISSLYTNSFITLLSHNEMLEVDQETGNAILCSYQKAWRKNLEPLSSCIEMKVNVFPGCYVTRASIHNDVLLISYSDSSSKGKKECGFNLYSLAKSKIMLSNVRTDNPVGGIIIQQKLVQITKDSARVNEIKDPYLIINRNSCPPGSLKQNRTTWCSMKVVGQTSIVGIFTHLRVAIHDDIKTSIEIRDAIDNLQIELSTGVERKLPISEDDISGNGLSFKYETSENYKDLIQLEVTHESDMMATFSDLSLEDTNFDQIVLGEGYAFTLTDSRFITYWICKNPTMLTLNCSSSMMIMLDYENPILLNGGMANGEIPFLFLTYRGEPIYASALYFFDLRYTGRYWVDYTVRECLLFITPGAYTGLGSLKVAFLTDDLDIGEDGTVMIYKLSDMEKEEFYYEGQITWRHTYSLKFCPKKIHVSDTGMLVVVSICDQDAPSGLQNIDILTYDPVEYFKPKSEKRVFGVLNSSQVCFSGDKVIIAGQTDESSQFFAVPFNGISSDRINLVDYTGKGTFQSISCPIQSSLYSLVFKDKSGEGYSVLNFHRFFDQTPKVSAMLHSISYMATAPTHTGWLSSRLVHMYKGKDGDAGYRLRAAIYGGPFFWVRVFEAKSSSDRDIEVKIVATSPWRVVEKAFRLKVRRYTATIKTSVTSVGNLTSFNQWGEVNIEEYINIRGPVLLGYLDNSNPELTLVKRMEEVNTYLPVSRRNTYSLVKCFGPLVLGVAHSAGMLYVDLFQKSQLVETYRFQLLTQPRAIAIDYSHPDNRSISELSVFVNTFAMASEKPRMVYFKGYQGEQVGPMIEMGVVKAKSLEASGGMLLIQSSQSLTLVRFISETQTNSIIQVDGIVASSFAKNNSDLILVTLAADRSQVNVNLFTDLEKIPTICYKFKLPDGIRLYSLKCREDASYSLIRCVGTSHGEFLIEFILKDGITAHEIYLYDKPGFLDISEVDIIEDTIVATMSSIGNATRRFGIFSWRSQRTTSGSKSVFFRQMFKQKLYQQSNFWTRIPFALRKSSTYGTMTLITGTLKPEEPLKFYRVGDFRLNLKYDTANFSNYNLNLIDSKGVVTTVNLAKFMEAKTDKQGDTKIIDQRIESLATACALTLMLIIAIVLLYVKRKKRSKGENENSMTSSIMEQEPSPGDLITRPFAKAY